MIASVASLPKVKLHGPECFTNCPAHNNAPWDVLIVVGCFVVLFLVVAVAAALAGHWDHRHRA